MLVHWFGSLALLLSVGTAAWGQPAATFIPSGSGFAVKTLNGPVVLREGGFDAGSIHVDYLGLPQRSRPFVRVVAQVAPYDSILYPNLYPGTDLSFHLTGGLLKSEFELQPGADVSRIHWRYDRATALHLLPGGALEAITPAGSIRESSLVAWQTAGEKRVPVSLRYEILPDDTVGLIAGPFDKRLPLLIDPTLTFSSTTGGSGIDTITGVGRDAAGNIYLSGWTDSTVFSAAASQFPRSHSADAFVMKLNASTKALMYLTYLAGSGDDRALAIAVDGDGFVYVCGSTSSSDFPAIHAQQAYLNGGYNAFLAKLDPTGQKILFSTYFGGAGNTRANAIALDSSGNVFIAGETDSTTLPTVLPFQPVSGGGLDAFLVKFTSTGVVQYASYLGGSGDDRGLGVAVDSTGNAYVTGSTSSNNFPVRAPFQSQRKGFQDAFVAKVNASGSATVYSTYLGGSGGDIGQPEQANAITVDSQGAAYVVGTTNSPDFPLVNPYQAKFIGWNSDAFIAKLNPAGSQLVFSTYLGGGDTDVATAVRLDSAGNVYVAGYTASPDFPAVQPVQALMGGLYDAFLAKLGPAGNTLLFSSVLGGRQNDIAYSIAGSNEVIVGGSTASSDLFSGVLGINAMEFGVQISPFAPFGTVDTPTDKTTGLSGAIGVTGWALCDDQVPAITVWRERLTGEPGGGLIFLGTATVINLARPDVAAAFPTFEFNGRAGWGYALLTNMLMNSAGNAYPIGNGTYRFHGIATNLQGQSVDLGTKTVTVDNAHSSAPFGTIDTPSQGQTISGTFVNFGWALTPQPATIPFDGSTLVVYIDDLPVGHPSYNNDRPDISSLFPGLNNSHGAVGAYVFDSATLVNGPHTIQWSVTDSAGHASGIGSRTFFVQN